MFHMETHQIIIIVITILTGLITVILSHLKSTKVKLSSHDIMKLRRSRSKFNRYMKMNEGRMIRFFRNYRSYGYTRNEMIVIMDEWNRKENRIINDYRRVYMDRYS